MPNWLSWNPETQEITECNSDGAEMVVGHAKTAKEALSFRDMIADEGWPYERIAIPDNQLTKEENN